MPSVPELQHPHVISLSPKAEKEQGSAQADSVRLRLVEAFFHSQPHDLQATADFVVRRAVHNACEEILAVVVRPAAAIAVSQLWAVSKPNANLSASISIRDGVVTRDTSTGDIDGDKLWGEFTVVPRSRLEQRVVWATAALKQRVGSKSRFLAGRKSHLLAHGSILSLAPQSLAPR